MTPPYSSVSPDCPLVGLTCCGCGHPLTEKHALVTVTKQIDGQFETLLYHGCCLIAALDAPKHYRLSDLFNQQEQG